MSTASKEFGVHWEARPLGSAVTYATGTHVKSVTGTQRQEHVLLAGSKRTLWRRLFEA